MTAEPTVAPEAYDLVGQEKSLITFPISARHIAEYCAGGDNWRVADGGGFLAPPLFFLAASRRVEPIDNLLEDGQYRDLTIPGITGRSVLASWDVEILDTVKPGDVVTVYQNLKSITEKDGRTGKLVIVEQESRHVNQDGTLVGLDVQTIIYM